MNETFTSDFIITEKNLQQALELEEAHTPSSKSLEFIRNFARNFRFCYEIEGRAGDLILN